LTISKIIYLSISKFELKKAEDDNFLNLYLGVLILSPFAGAGGLMHEALMERYIFTNHLSTYWL